MNSFEKGQDVKVGSLNPAEGTFEGVASQRVAHLAPIIGTEYVIRITHSPEGCPFEEGRVYSISASVVYPA